MDIDAFDYPLPDAAIAQAPATPRDASRLLDCLGTEFVHRRTGDLPHLIRPGDVVVVNDTRVLAARLHLRKPSGGAVEVLVTEPSDPPADADADADGAGTDGAEWWLALVRPSRRVPDRTRLLGADGRAVLEVGAATDGGTRMVRPIGVAMTDLLAQAGQVPLPPYITRPVDEAERYQTVYARRATSVAAPTAGLHLTPEVLARIEAAGASLVRVELSVGIGTFRPITATRVDDHVMHAERYAVAPDAWEAIRGAERVVAIGTTVVRTLESVAATGALAGSTDLYIRPGFAFDVVDVLFTNFHLPRSSLLVMLEAFMGPRWRLAYDEALAAGYRFLSFGDAMVCARSG